MNCHASAISGDVYKRQDEHLYKLFPKQLAACKEEMEQARQQFQEIGLLQGTEAFLVRLVSPVSYTHLDVYKRHQYNKSRQQAITNELLDIIGGSLK